MKTLQLPKYKTTHAHAPESTVDVVVFFVLCFEFQILSDTQTNDFGGRVRRLIDFGLSGATPVDKINTKIVFLSKGFWYANDFGGRVRRLIDFGLSGSTPVDKSNVLEVKIELWLDT